MERPEDAEQAQSTEVRIVQAENLTWMRAQPDGGHHLIYADPPYHTGRVQRRLQVRATPDEDGTPGFGGRRYRREVLGERAFDDRFESPEAYLAFLEERLVELVRLMEPTGSLFLHLDPRECHYAKVLLDRLLGRRAFINQIVWAYDYGARSRRRWPAKHDVILWYARDPRRYTFRYGEIDRVPYMAPRLVGAEKAARGKTPTDVWWHTIVSPTGKERTGYPTQKPLGVLERIVRVHSLPGEHVLDVFAGSGTTGEAAWRLGRHVTLVDESPGAVEVMAARLAGAAPVVERPGPGR